MVWKEIDVQEYNYWLGEGWPIYRENNVFAVREILDFRPDGEAIYTVCRETDGVYFHGEGTLKEAEYQL